MTKHEYMETVGLKTNIIDDEEGKERTLLELPFHDPITCTSDQELMNADTIIEVCARNCVGVDDLWTLLCVGVG